MLSLQLSIIRFIRNDNIYRQFYSLAVQQNDVDDDGDVFGVHSICVARVTHRTFNLIMELYFDSAIGIGNGFHAETRTFQINTQREPVCIATEKTKKTKNKFGASTVSVHIDKLTVFCRMIASDCYVKLFHMYTKPYEPISTLTHTQTAVTVLKWVAQLVLPHNRDSVDEFLITKIVNYFNLFLRCSCALRLCHIYFCWLWMRTAVPDYEMIFLKKKKKWEKDWLGWLIMMMDTAVCCHNKM